jgi:hypothetical protein
LVRFLTSLAALTAAIVSAVYLGAKDHWWNRPSFTFEIILFLASSTGAIYYFLIRRSPSTFTLSYLLSIVLKMLCGSLLILLVIFKDRQGSVGNALLFVVAYLLFTGLEVGFLFHRVNR